MAHTQLSEQEEEQLYYFYRALAHELIRDTVLYQPFMLNFIKLKTESQLKRLWHEAWTYSNMPKKPAMHDFSSTFRTEGEYEIVLFTFPQPIGMTNAWMSVAIRSEGADSCRYFTLEDAMDSTPEKPEAMLCEWTPDGHKNYGLFSGDVQSPDEFIKSSLQVIRS
ncbi:hypothetical protein [Telluribacter sp.]|uniref:hypothetical protein n=1 Tax=Telluribacter sp. TaxID=1978767 RepID=UPI002E168041|nr:hypothetical protein [Telluribacter sp.]